MRIPLLYPPIEAGRGGSPREDDNPLREDDSTDKARILALTSSRMPFPSMEMLENMMDMRRLLSRRHDP